MSNLAEAIQDHLFRVGAERERRLADPALARKVQEVKRYQHARFSATYADLLTAPGSRKAAMFFLEELYGPGNFAQRDAEFLRVAPSVARFFPGEIGQIVLNLARLHSLSEELDSKMGAVVQDLPLSAAGYRDVWREVGQPDARQDQLQLVEAVGMALAKQVRRLLIRSTLRMMRAPANTAGLSHLQTVLESGFDAFRELPDAQAFVRTIAERESRIEAALFGSTIASG